MRAAQECLQFERGEMKVHAQQGVPSKQEVSNVPGPSTNKDSHSKNTSALPNINVSNLKQILNTVTTSEAVQDTSSSVDLSNLKTTPSSLNLSDIKSTPSSIDVSNIKTTPSSMYLKSETLPNIKTTPSSLDIHERAKQQSLDVGERAKQHGLSLEKKLRKMKSVYPDLPAALSPFEREALMLGIPDENVEIRHLNQVFIRGENIVSVNIVQDF